MEYKGVDYVNKEPNENANIMFDFICVELVKRNSGLFDIAKNITKKHIDVMINDTDNTDKKRDALLSLKPTLKPTWKAIKKELDEIKMLLIIYND